MISLLFYFMFFVNLFLVVNKKSSKTIASISWVILLFVYGGNIRAGFSDLTYYRQRYYENLNSIIFDDKGYVWLADFFSHNDVSFQVFLAVIFIISSISIYFIAKKLQCNYNLLILLFSLFYFFYSLEVIRFFIANSIALVAYYWLFHQKRLFFILGMIIAYFFHASIIFLLPFVFFYSIKDGNKKISLLIVVSVFLIVMNLLNGNQSSYLIGLFGPIFNSDSLKERIQFYTGASTRLGFLIYYLYFIFNMVTIYHIRKISYHIENLPLNKLKVVAGVYQQNLYCVIFLPLIMFNVTFFRYIIFTTTLNFVCYAMIFPYLKKSFSKNNNHLVIILSITGFTILWWIMKENVLMFYEALQVNMFN
ncbi:EpsG family protein [Streptococcus sp. 2018037]|uniref:EpsG family protein n=1 Tax=Streptococcus TaxID=1301 RepID=UPI000CF5A778|nr:MULTISPECIES: EpsG family protein [Streptococcus]MBM7266958.1 EpsG family protein [Streptococcus suis]MBY0752259.1 EpsG family protein [Streptococcus sp. 2018037]